jgi:hypothetical protein
LGDKTGTFHVGPKQELTADLPEDSPELQFGLIIYPDGTMQTAKDSKNKLLHGFLHRRYV